MWRRTNGPRAHSPSYKEDPPEGWKEAQPNDGVIKGKWWEIFGDPNQRAGGAGQYLQPERAAGGGAVQLGKGRGAGCPVGVVSHRVATPSITGSQASNRLSTRTGSNSPVGDYTLPFSASYTADVWGAIHRTVLASANTAQSLDAALENVRLLYQSELAQDYFQLHGLDAITICCSRRCSRTPTT